ncbi:LOW QUALITY PROTEIN: hypothetical protein J0S82_005260, partial [Galemys pyrenaicus]
KATGSLKSRTQGSGSGSRGQVRRRLGVGPGNRLSEAGGGFSSEGAFAKKPSPSGKQGRCPPRTSLKVKQCLARGASVEGLRQSYLRKPRFNAPLLRLEITPTSDLPLPLPAWDFTTAVVLQQKMTQDGPLLAVQEALKKCFPVVEEQQGLWQSTLEDCRPLLVSLSNLAEQLQAAQNLRWEDVPALRAFPDLQERLTRKQLSAGDLVLDKLGEKLAVLLKVRDTVSSHVDRVLQVYEQHADAIDIGDILKASYVSPSVADMLEWLRDIERHYRRRYLKRKHLLSSIHWEDVANIQALPRAWDRISEDGNQDLVHDILLSVTFFLE